MVASVQHFWQNNNITQKNLQREVYMTTFFATAP